MDEHMKLLARWTRLYDRGDIQFLDSPCPECAQYMLVRRSGSACLNCGFKRYPRGGF